MIRSLGCSSWLRLIAPISFVALLLLWVPNEGAAQEQISEEQKAVTNAKREIGKYSQNQLKISWLSSAKIRADEAFIVSDKDKLTLPTAIDLYQLVMRHSCTETGSFTEATDGTSQQPASSSDVEDATLSLLCEEARYRLLLIQHNIGFWGLIRLQTPSAPHAHLARLRSLVADLRSLHRIVLESTDTATALDREERKYISSELGAQQTTETQSAALERAEIQIRENERDNRIIGLTLEAIRAEREYQRNRQGRAFAQYEAANSRMNSLIIQGVSQLAGLPPELVTSLKDGDLKGIATSAIGSDLVQSSIKSQLTEIAKGNRQIASAVKDFQKYNDKFNELRQKYKEVKQYIRDAKEIVEIIREPSIEGLARIGNIVYDHLPEADKKKVREKVAKAKPLAIALQMARRPDGLGQYVRGKVKQYAARELTKNKFVLKRMVLDSVPLKELRRVYSRVVSTVFPLLNEVGGLSDTLRDVVRSYSDILLIDPGAKIEPLLRGTRFERDVPKFRKELRELIDKHCAKEVQAYNASADSGPGSGINKLRQTCFERMLTGKNPVAVSVQREPTSGRLFFHIDTTEFQLELGQGADKIVDLEKRLAGLGGLSDAQIKVRLERILDKALGSSDEVVERLIEALPIASLTGKLEELARNKDLKGGKEQEKLFDNLFGDLTGGAEAMPANCPEAGAIVEEATGKCMLLTETSKTIIAIPAASQVNETLAKNDASASVISSLRKAEDQALDFAKAQGIDPSSTNASRGGLDPNVELAVSTALNAAFPGAGIALNLAKSFFAAQSALDEAADAGAKLVKTLDDEARILEQAHRSEVARELVLQEARLAVHLKRLAALQIRLHEANATSAAEDANEVRTRIKRRMPLFFYLSERLREEFDLLEASLRRWGGFENSPGGIITELVRDDPQNIRYATDSEIHLYTWLNRAVEGGRTDVDAMLVHWEQLLRLSEDSCKILGCDSGAIDASEVRQSDPLSLLKLLSRTDVQRFKRWRSCLRKWNGDVEAASSQPHCSGRPESFLAKFSVKSEDLGLWPNEYNVRLVDVRAGFWKSGTPLGVGQGANVAHGVTLTHSGYGNVLNRDRRPEFDVLLPRAASSFDRVFPFDLGDLRLRWNRDYTVQRRVFEGYPALTDWVIEISPAYFGKLDVDTLILRFAFQTLSTQNALTEKQALSNELIKGAPSATKLLVRWDAELNGTPIRQIEYEVQEADLAELTGGLREYLNASTNAVEGPKNPIDCEASGRVWIAGPGQSTAQPHCSGLSWTGLESRFGNPGLLGNVAVPKKVEIVRQCKRPSDLTAEYFRWGAIGARYRVAGRQAGREFSDIISQAEPLDRGVSDSIENSVPSDLAVSARDSACNALKAADCLPEAVDYDGCIARADTPDNKRYKSGGEVVVTLGQ